MQTVCEVKVQQWINRIRELSLEYCNRGNGRARTYNSRYQIIRVNKIRVKRSVKIAIESSRGTQLRCDYNWPWNLLSPLCIARLWSYKRIRLIFSSPSLQDFKKGEN